MPNRNRGIAASAAGLLILALNVIDAADRGASAGNIVAIAGGAFLLVALVIGLRSLADLKR